MYLCRLLWICRTGLRCTAPPWSQRSASPCASSCGPAGSRTPGAPCPGCCSSRWRRTTSATASGTVSGCVRLETRHPSLSGCTSPSQPLSLTCARCSCIWPAPETWSPPNTASPSTSETLAWLWALYLFNCLFFSQHKFGTGNISISSSLPHCHSNIIRPYSLRDWPYGWYF